MARNIVAQDVMEVLLSNNDGASGGPLVDTRGEVNARTLYINTCTQHMNRLFSVERP